MKKAKENPLKGLETCRYVHLGRLKRKNAELMQIQETLLESVSQFKTIFDNTLVGPVSYQSRWPDPNGQRGTPGDTGI